MALTKTKLFNVQSISKYQSRAGRQNDAIVAEYAERYSEGKKMSPIDVCGTHNLGFFIFDGHQRFAGMKQAGFTGDTEIMVNVVDARIEQAVVKWLAAGANTEHGLRRSNDDKRRAVEMALESHPEQSDRAIADHVGTSHEFVRQLRGQLSTADSSKSPEKRVGLDGKSRSLPPPPAQRAKTPPPASTEPPKASDQDGAATIPPAPSKPPAAIVASTATPPPTYEPAEQAGRKVDEMMRPIPEDLYEHFQRRTDLMSHVAKLREIERVISLGRKERDPLYAQVTQETIAYIGNARKALEDCMPYAVCPWCGGMNPGCKMCGNRGGFVSKHQIERFAKPDPEVWKLVSPVPVESEG